MSSKTAAETAPRPWSLAVRMTAWYALAAIIVLTLAAVIPYLDRKSVV